MDALVGSYLVGMGEYNTDNMEGKTLLYCYFMLATFVTQLVFMNMLIAVMGDTYDRASGMR